MTSLKSALRKVLSGVVAEPIEDAPPAEIVVAPESLEQAGQVLDLASEHRLPVLIWGGGTHQGLGAPIDPAILLTTHRLDRVVAWQPDDLTVVVEAGVRVGDLEAQLAERDQTAILPELPGSATVGGVVAAGVSAWRRLRYGPTRDRMLEVELVTGDGRLVRAGGRVVKNVTGYDLPRLAAGSFGGLGLIGRVCLKLWPHPAATATVTLPARRTDYGYRPMAIIEEPDRVRVYLGGTPEEVEARAAELDGDVSEGLQWPAPLENPIRCSLRIPPRLVHEAVDRLPAGWRYQASPGVGEVKTGAAEFVAGEAETLRTWAEAQGGSLALIAAPPSVYEAFDPWGSPPAGQELQRRVVARFDPRRVVNPGRLPGGI